jgi:hypothetical protein
MSKRWNVTIKLSENDGELIGKLKAIPDGRRSAAIKDAIRQHLGLPKRGLVFDQHTAALPVQLPLLEEIFNGMEYMKAAVNDMPNYFERLIRDVATTGAVAPPPPEPERPKASRLQMEQRDAKLAKAEW